MSNKLFCKIEIAWNPEEKVISTIYLWPLTQHHTICLEHEVQVRYEIAKWVTFLWGRGRGREIVG